MVELVDHNIIGKALGLEFIGGEETADRGGNPVKTGMVCPGVDSCLALWVTLQNIPVQCLDKIRYTAGRIPGKYGSAGSKCQVGVVKKESRVDKHWIWDYAIQCFFSVSTTVNEVIDEDLYRIAMDEATQPVALPFSIALTS